MRITKTQIKAAPVTGLRYTIQDDMPGLQVLVLPTGVKSWRFRYRTAGGVQRAHTLGPAEAIHPDEARRMATELLVDARGGGDPTAERRQARQAPKFEALVERYLAEHVLTLKPRSQANVRSYLKNWILPAFTGRRVAEIRDEDLLRWFRGIEKKTTANRCAEVMSKMMGLAKVWGMRADPPPTFPAYREERRERYLSGEEAKALMREVRALRFSESSYSQAFGDLVLLLMLTGARLRELSHCQWQWVDLEAGKIRLPDSKTGRRTIMLSAEAVQVLGARPRVNGLVFGTKLEDYRRRWLALCESAGVEGLRVHDLRHSFASFALSGGVPLAVIGELLGHSSPVTTKRYSHLLDDAGRSAVDAVSRVVVG